MSGALTLRQPVSRAGFYIPVSLGRSIVSGPMDPGTAENLRPMIQTQISQLGEATDRAIDEWTALETGSSDLGLGFTASQDRMQILAELGALRDLSSRLMKGAPSGYLIPQEKSVLGVVISRQDSLARALKAKGPASITGQNQRVSDERIQDRVGSIQALGDQIDRMIVNSEGPRIDVLEPAERTSFLVIALGVAILGLAAFGVYYFWKTA